MKFFAWPLALVASLALLAPVAHADSRQYIVVVAEGVSPQLLTLGQDYLRKADESTELETTFTALAKNGKMAEVSPNALGEMKGLLETAHASGFKTGLITTGDLTAEAPLFYNVTGDALGSTDAHYDFLAGGGRAKLEVAGESVMDTGGTYINTTDGLVREIKGRVLAAQADEELSYALDRNPEKEGGISELATMAMDMLGDNDTPFVLVVHDTLLQKALAAKDTPALFEEFRELNSIMDEAMNRREVNPNLSITALLPGAASVPVFANGTDTDKTYSVISSLGRSYQGVGTLFKETKGDTLAEFTDPESGEYRDWKLSEADRKRIASGKLDGEKAARAFYEPLLGLNYTPETTPPLAYSIGLYVQNGLAAALKTALSKPSKEN